MAYDADDKAHMDRFDDDVEMRLCEDVMKRGNHMMKTWSNPDGIIPSMLITR